MLHLFRSGTSIPGKIRLTIELAIALALVVAIIGSVFESLWSTAFVSGLSLALIIILPSFIERQQHIVLPTEFQLAIILFIFGTLFLGEVANYYARFWWWDVVLHAGSAMVFGIVGFLILYAMRASKKIMGSPFVIALFSFLFALAIGTLWEIFEFTIDQLVFGMSRMQRSGLIDTMFDLIVDAIGGLVGAISGYAYLKNGEKSWVAYLIKKFVAKNPHLFHSL